MKGKLIATVARAKKLKAADLYLADECVKSRKNKAFALAVPGFCDRRHHAARWALCGGPIHGTGMFMPEFTSALGDPETSQGGHPNVHYTVGCAGIVVRSTRRPAN